MKSYLEKQIIENQKIFSFLDTHNGECAIVTLLIYKNIDQKLRDTLKLFFLAHLKFNQQCVIYVFTNIPKQIVTINNSSRIIITEYRIRDNNNFMTTRVVFNYLAMKSFKNFKRIFLIDSDLIPLRKYNDLKILLNNFDVAFTFQNAWRKSNKFPFNAGFILINNENKLNINKFCDLTIGLYQNIISDQKIVFQSNLVHHVENINFKSRNLEEWFGDQYLLASFFHDDLNHNIDLNKDLVKFGIKFRLLNEDRFNWFSVLLKRSELGVDLNKYLDEKKKGRVFMHLKGDTMKFSNIICQYLGLVK